ncbi:MAG TPA: hypothetical protein DIW31_03825 [Bacteroidales bacterium]|nr:hypothetical protein [Bacteroidales bacterium]
MIKAKLPLYFFAFSISIASLLILHLTMVELEENTSYPSSSNEGVINISAFDLTSTNLIGIVGEFEFYWNQLLTPSDFKDSSKIKSKKYIHLPGLWNGYEWNNKKLSADGYATFRVVINVPDEDLYSIKVKEFDCAYRLWINGLYTECGKVGTNKQEEEPSWKRNEVIFFAKDKKAELIIQVSNFNHRKGGPEDLMLLGKSKSVVIYKNKQLAITYFLIGIFFIMFVYNYGLFIYRRKEKSHLFFSIICLLIMLRESTTGEKVIYDVFPNINWWVMIKIEYLSYTLAIPLFYMFVRTLNSEYLSKFFEKLIITISLIVASIILFAPVKIFSYTPIFYQAIVALAAIMIIVSLTKAVLNKKDDSIIMLFGYFMLFVISINDILYYNKILNTTFLMPFGLFLIVFINAFTLSKRFSNSFTIIEGLTEELSQNNLELEKKVTERTQEVVKQKYEIENQAKALQETNKKIITLSNFKDSMTHMIVHDLKNPLNTIINASIMDDIPEKNNLIHEAGREMNNLVMNILDVYKYENTTMVLNKGNIDLTELIEDAINDVAFLGKLRSIAFSIVINENIEVNVDKSIMHRVLVNILTNAIKFSPITGKIEISTSLHNSDFIKISIRDHGPGVRPERQKAIFDRFQSENQNDNLIASTGLGLNFCKLAIDSHGGDIFVESKEMKGSTFNIIIPLTESFEKNTQKIRREINYQQQKEDVLTSTDKSVILPYLDELKNFEVYQISDILRVLNKFSKNDSESLQKWILMVTDAVLLSQQNRYIELLNNV